MRVVEGEAVVLVQDRAVIVGLDPVGTRAIGLMTGDVTPRGIAGALRRQLAAGAADVEGDVLRFLTELVSLGVVEVVEALTGDGTG
ncbi:MAG: PqqD family protein [Thermoanaerobaculaceae bacterium]|jgi:hypothetical protein|nr:PqqD family protein [Thermoanaerobaculaceae bacterium]